MKWTLVCHRLEFIEWVEEVARQYNAAQSPESLKCNQMKDLPMELGADIDYPIFVSMHWNVFPSILKLTLDDVADLEQQRVEVL